MNITIVMGFFLPMPPVAGGATEKSWAALAREFASRGHYVTIISRRWPSWPDQETADGIRHLRLRGFDHSSRLRRNLWLDLLWSLRVWLHLPAADITVVNCVALPVWLGWFRRRSGHLVVMTGRAPKGRYRAYRRLDWVLAVSSTVRAQLLAENPHLGARTRLTGYPISWSLLSAARAPEVPGAPVTLGYVGRLHREKGLSLLAEALRLLARQSQLPPWRFALCGPADVARGGSGPGYLAELTALLPPGRFAVREPLFDSAALAAVYREIDIFCYPSLAEHGETFGVAVAEAMAAGAVPVVSSLSCFGDFVSPGENGESFDHRAPDAATRLAATLANLLADPLRRARLAQAAQREVRRYDAPAVAERLLADFSALL